MLRIAYCAAFAVVVLSVNLHAIGAGVLERALRYAALVGLVVLAATAAVPFTGLVTERGGVRAIGLRAVAIGLLFMAGAMVAWNIVVAVHRLSSDGR